MKRRASSSKDVATPPIPLLRIPERPPSPRSRMRKQSTRARSKSDDVDAYKGIGMDTSPLLHRAWESPIAEESSAKWEDESETCIRVSFWDQLRRDLGWFPVDTRTDDSELLDDADVFVFLRIPLKLEKVLLFGFFSCLDTFLFMFTLFPLRVLGALVSGIVSLLRYIKLLPGRRSFGRTQMYDLLRACIMLVTVWTLLQVHMSRIYHYVRGQTFIKLYVIFNMLEIFDKLMCSVGQEVTDALYLSTQRAPRAFLRVGIRTTFALLYSVLHSLLYFTRLITLNAAINSTNNALLTILISNNFVELKSSVFKRSAKENLFQISCSDIVERFELFTFLSLTAVQSSDNLWQFLEPTLYVVTCELIVDWIKHSFISKFNGIPAVLYADYLEILCQDVAPHTGTDGTHQSMHRSTNGAYKLIDVDPTQVVVRRVGLGLLPLTCVVLRFIYTHVAEPMLPALMACIEAGPVDGLFPLLSLCATTLLLFANLVAVKLLLNTVLKTVAASVLTNAQMTPDEQSHSSSIEQLSTVQRYTMRTSRIPM